MKIKCINKGLDFINISGILRNPEIQKLIPSYFDNIETLMLSCSYNISSRGMIFNYTSVSADENIKNNCPKSCSCVNYKFIYQPCGNVATGDLNIVKYKENKRFLQKEPTYHPLSKINWKTVVMSSVDVFIVISDTRGIVLIKTSLSSFLTNLWTLRIYELHNLIIVSYLIKYKICQSLELNIDKKN